MKVGVAQTIVGKCVKGRSLDDPTECTGSTIAHIIDEYPHHVGCAGRGLHGFRPPFLRLSESSAHNALIRLCRLRIQRETGTRRKDERRCQRIQYTLLVHISPVGLCHSVMTQLKVVSQAAEDVGEADFLLALAHSITRAGARFCLSSSAMNRMYGSM